MILNLDELAINLLLHKFRMREKLALVTHGEIKLKSGHVAIQLHPIIHRLICLLLILHSFLLFLQNAVADFLDPRPCIHCFLLSEPDIVFQGINDLPRIYCE